MPTNTRSVSDVLVVALLLQDGFSLLECSKMTGLSTGHCKRVRFSDGKFISSVLQHYDFTIPIRGISITESYKRRLLDAVIEVEPTPETYYIIESPDGVFYETNSVNGFCLDPELSHYNLKPNLLYWVANHHKNCKHHKGFKIVKFTKLPDDYFG